MARALIALMVVPSLALPASVAAAVAPQVSPAPMPDDTWVALTSLPDLGPQPILALATDPDGSVVLVGTAAGSVYRSRDGGASWAQVHAGRAAVLAIAFNPLQPGQVLAGTEGDGIWASTDGGDHWARQELPVMAWVRSFGFTKSMVVAGTDRGVLVGRGGRWTAAGLEQLRVTSVVASVVNDPAQILVGADASGGGELLPLYGGQTNGPDSPQDAPPAWQLVKVPGAASNMVSALAAGPLRGSSRPVLLGTSAGAFLSGDAGGTWNTLAKLPPTDFNQVAFSPNHWDRFYVASDGGGSVGGGLWATSNFGSDFRPLSPPVPSVTAMALSGAEVPVLYAATFRSPDHAVMLWSYRDAGGSSKGPIGGVRPVSIRDRGQAASASQPPQDPIRSLLTGPEAPFLVVGMGAVLVLLLALVTYLRRGRA